MDITMDTLVAQIVTLGIVVDIMLEVEQETYVVLADRHTKLDQMIVMLDTIRDQLVEERAKI